MYKKANYKEHDESKKKTSKASNALNPKDLAVGVIKEDINKYMSADTDDKTKVRKRAKIPFQTKGTKIRQ